MGMSPPIIFTRKFITLGKAIAFTSSVTADAHGFGVTPTLTVCYLRCTSAEGNFSVGESVQLCGGFPHDASRGMQLRRNATQSIMDIGGSVNLLNAATKVEFAITPANWVLDFIDFL